MASFFDRIVEITTNAVRIVNENNTQSARDFFMSHKTNILNKIEDAAIRGHTDIDYNVVIPSNVDRDNLDTIINEDNDLGQFDSYIDGHSISFEWHENYEDEG